MRVIKVFFIVTFVVAAILLGFFLIEGSRITSSLCYQTFEISALASAVVIILWFSVGYLLCTPVVKLLNRTFELMGR